jgi:hypothetical protein
VILAGKFFQKKGFFSILTGNLENPLWKPCSEYILKNMAEERQGRVPNV